MAHKVHPKVFRIKEITDWDSRWFHGKRMAKLLRDDLRIRNYVQKKLVNMGIEKVEIERLQNRLNVIISSSRPGLIIGRGGGGVDELKKKLDALLKKSNDTSTIKEVKIEVREIKDPWESASLTAQLVAQQVEKRMQYRRVLKQTIEKVIAHKSVQGVRIELSGRLDGASIARREWLRKGQLPRQTIRADIDFAKAKAQCSYGTVGVKVWIYKGEKFEK